MVDQSFRALVYSIAAHIILAWLIITKLPQNEILPDQKPVEFTVMEPTHRVHMRPVVAETNLKPENDVNKLKKEADLLSKFTKRVQEQVIARQSGQTKNRTGQLPVESDERRAQGELGSGAERINRLRLATPTEKGPSQSMKYGSSGIGRDIVSGISTTSQIIPGIKSASFTALNTDAGYAYYTFFNRVQEQFYPRWVHNVRAHLDSYNDDALKMFFTRERVTEVDIQLHPDGSVARALVIRSCGNTELDKAGILAFTDAAPFRNPPRDLVEPDGLIHVRGNLTLQ